MRTLLFCTFLLFVATGGAATATGTVVEVDAVTDATTAAAFVPPDIPANHGGCDYFHWHNGDVKNGRLPTYHYHACLGADGDASASAIAAFVPPDIPANHGGCDYFHWHNGDVKNGRLPTYHYHACLADAGASVAAAQAASMAPPDLPPNHSGCGYFYWDSGDIKSGEAPGYRYRHCV